jgi:predicted metalloenzyme YecM
MKQVLALHAEMIGEVDVNGRLMATFECEQPLEASGWLIPYIELPQPKASAPYPEGLEHVELVTLSSLRGFERRHSELPFGQDGMNKKINPELGLKHAGISVKFHEQPLGAVVRLESRLGIHD